MYMYITIVNSNNRVKKYGNCSGVTTKVYGQATKGERYACKVYNYIISTKIILYKKHCVLNQFAARLSYSTFMFL